MLRFMQVVPRREVPPDYKSIGFGAKHIKEPVSGLAVFSRCLWTYLDWQEREMAPAGPFLPGETMPPLSKHSKKREQSLPGVLGDPKIMPSIPGLPACFLYRSTAMPSGVYNQLCHRPLKRQCLNPSNCKNSQISYFSNQWFLGKCYPCVIACSLLSSIYPWQGSHPSVVSLIHFSPKQHFHISYLPWYDLFSLSSCAVV